VSTPRRPRSDAVLFDLDGVLVDSRLAISRAINHALAFQGHRERPVAELHRFIGPPLAVAFAELTGEPVDSTAVAACVTAYRERYAVSSLSQTEVVPGIPETLDALVQQGHRLAVATSKALGLAEPLLTALGLRERFEVVAGPDLSGGVEDKTATVSTTLHALGGPDRAVMVGDRSFDIVAAHANGIAAVGVAWGIGTATELATARADALADAPSALPAIIRTLLERRHARVASRNSAKGTVSNPEENRTTTLPE
jgi:phosphoglycolate phosphatase